MSRDGSLSIAHNAAGIRAGLQYANQTADWGQLRQLGELAALLSEDGELFAASLIADEVYFALHPEHAGDGQASWLFWQRLAGSMVSREYVLGFVCGAVEVLNQSLVPAGESTAPYSLANCTNE